MGCWDEYVISILFIYFLTTGLAPLYYRYICGIYLVMFNTDKCGSKRPSENTLEKRLTRVLVFRVLPVGLSNTGQIDGHDIRVRKYRNTTKGKKKYRRYIFS